MITRQDAVISQGRGHAVRISLKLGEADLSISIANCTVIGIMKGCTI
jgi:hypothetical protein